ncbi:MAG: phenylalanine--tRNA ligase subunit beta [Rhodothermales bacterium]|nr:phenylalanine--tRNA ligase subunit beta [Rhodothermales bacterium]
MKISYNWLKEYVDVTASPADLADMLTMAGLEVESVDAIGGMPDGVVVGHVLSVDRHPDADRLTVCSVDVGASEPLQIICGAPNVESGQLAPVAKIGARLSIPDTRAEGGFSDIVVSSRSMRGVESNGMICAEDELGLSTDHSGIMVLAKDAKIGEPLQEYLERTTGRREDFVIDIAVTPNRPDATCHVGIARDVAALTNQPLRIPEVTIPTGPGEAGNHVAVTIASPELCHRYVGVVVEGVRVGESPDWLKVRLEAVGLRPRNNIVDITNFVMYEIGQPLHAFDLDELSGARIEVRATEAPTKFTTLDDKERELPAGTLMIRDGERDVAIAGVMGGQNSEVSDRTVNVLIESAYFDPSTVRRTARHTGLQTDASYRFERGVDPEVQAVAAMRAATLMAKIADGTVIDGIVDVHPAPHVLRQLEVRMMRADHVLGTRIPRPQAVRQLEAIGIGVTVGDGDRLSCTIPPFRPDIEREIDVIEEIARLHGYDKIEEPRTSRIPGFIPRTRKEDGARELLFSRLTGWGYREIYTNSLLPEERARAFYDEVISGDLYGGEVVTTANAITQEMTTLRPSLIPGLLQVARHNANHGRTDIRLVEVGHVFSRQQHESSIVPGYEEHEALALLLTGQDGERHWSHEPHTFDFHDISGTAAAIPDLLEIGNVTTRLHDEPSSIVEHGLSYFAEDVYIGFAGQLREEVAKEHDLAGPVLFAELNWTRILDRMPSIETRTYSPISRFPTVERDLAFVVDAGQSAGPMLDTIRNESGPLLTSVSVFDVYAGKSIGQGKKSIGFFLRFGADRTLTDKEVDARVEQVVRTVVRVYNADLRE